MSVAKVMWKYKIDVNSASGENWKKPSSSTILIDSPFNGDSNEETLNLNLLLTLNVNLVGNNRK